MIAAPLLGMLASYLVYGIGLIAPDTILRSCVARSLHTFWFSGWGFDWVYQRVFVVPFLWLARLNKHDIFDSVVSLLVRLTETANELLARSQTGSLRWYVLSVVGGMVVLLLATDLWGLL